MEISDLRNILNSNFQAVNKQIAVELVDLGFLKYKKLNPKNYEYWWYEVSDLSKINKKEFTFSWLDIALTSKFNFVKIFIDYHKENESAYDLIGNILNIISASGDGINLITKKSVLSEVIDFYYSHKTKKSKQLSLF